MNKSKSAISNLLSLCAIMLGLSACNNPTSNNIADTNPASVKNGIFSGHYVSSFEISSFTPCTQPEQPDYGQGYWLEAEQNSGFFDSYQTFLKKSGLDTSTNKMKGLTVFVRFEGQLSESNQPPGNGYGHLGMYLREVRVTKLLEMSLDDDKTRCKQSTS